MPEDGSAFSLRIRARPDGSATVSSRKHGFVVGAPVTFDEEDPNVSALEYVLGAAGAELVTAFVAAAKRRRLVLDHAEAVVKAALEDPLAAIGVIGAHGHPGLARLSVKVYASGEDEEALRSLWTETIASTPVTRTLARALPLELELVMAY